ncbi:MAG: TetR family transcriptional regulator C-terminal domain-containing protein [Methylococcales bacterium]|jgi:TetR/AcrR family transcriptional repressor of nem operon|nr:TetR family transcriptional regulator C-terminal domain-containing protein [Methylococcales bacterium]
MEIKQKDINRENLLNHGVVLLMQQGYHGTGLQEILDAVQIPKGSFYNYFGSKENFAAEIIGHYIEPYLVQLQTYLNQDDGNAFVALERYLNESIVELEKTKFKGGCLLGNLTGEIGDTSDICRDALQIALGRYRDVWEIGFSLAQKEGEIRIDKTAREMADLWVNSWQGALLRMKIEQSTAPLIHCKEALLDDFFKA